MKRWILGVAFCLVACGGTGQDTGEDPPPGETAGFDPGEVKPGYTRFQPAPIELDPGEDGIWCQWVAGPSDEDQDVVDVAGTQSAIGHHAVLYSTTAIEPAGTTRPCVDSDQLTMRFLGGIGGEGQSAVKLPEGTVFRLAKGRSLLVNAHYLNATSQRAKGESVVDVKLEPADPARQVAAFFTNVDSGINLPPHEETALDVTCTLKHDLGMVWWANHMHASGVKTFTERVAPDGKTEEIRRDDTWEYEWSFNPQFEAWPVDKPLSLKAGDTLRTRCVWQNTGSEAVKFPTEMCAGLGFFLGEKDVICHKGSWIE
jgi:hypothetical protein